MRWILLENQAFRIIARHLEGLTKPAGEHPERGAAYCHGCRCQLDDRLRGDPL